MADPTDSPTRRRPWRNSALPAVVLGLLVWTMVGCIYIPTWERVDLTGSRHDFRHLTVEKDGPGKPIARYRTSRKQVEALLGPPPFASPDGRRVAYTLTSRHGLWVVPLCLNVHSGDEEIVALGLEYGPDGAVQSYAMRSLKHDLAKVPPLEVEGNNFYGEYDYDAAVLSLPYPGLRPTGTGSPLPLEDPRWHDATPPRTGPIHP